MQKRNSEQPKNIRIPNGMSLFLSTLFFVDGSCLLSSSFSVCCEIFLLSLAFCVVVFQELLSKVFFFVVVGLLDLLVVGFVVVDLVVIFLVVKAVSFALEVDLGIARTEKKIKVSLL